MATKTLSPTFFQPLYNGAILPFGQIATYDAGTTTPATTYQDANGTTPNSNPIILDGDGKATIFLSPGSAYKYGVFDAEGNLLYTLDNIAAVPLTAPPTDINGIDQGRLTYESGVAVPDADLQNCQTLYYTPYNGNTVALYDATAGIWRLYTFAEISLDITGLSADTAYDIVLSLSGSTLTLESQAWTDPLTLPTRDMQNGVLVQAGDPTKRLVGSILMTSVAGRGADTYSFRGISNVTNPVPRSLIHFGQGTWNYTTATLRQANADPQNQVTAFACVAGRAVALTLQVTASNTNAAVGRYVAIGQNDTTAVATGCLYQGSTGAAADVLPMTATYHRVLTGGRVDLTWLEYSQATGTTTFIGADTVTQNGLSGDVLA